MSEQSKCELDEVLTSPSAFQQGTEQHKEEDHRGGDPQRDPEDTFRLHPEMPKRLVQGGSFPLNDFWNE